MTTKPKETQIIVPEERHMKAVEPQVQPADLMGAIVLAASNPEIDPDKMERMMAMYERIEAKKAEVAYNAAFAEMQGDLPEFTEGGQIKHDGRLISNYSRWDEDINPVLKPILKKHGFALSFRVATKEGVNVEAVLSHKDGHSERTDIQLPADTSGKKNAVQAVASSVSYGKRYTAGALLNLSSGGSDDDAQSAVSKPEIKCITKEQVENIEAIVTEISLDKDKLFEMWNIEEFEQLPAIKYNNAMKQLENRRKQGGKK